MVCAAGSDWLKGERTHSAALACGAAQFYRQPLPGHPPRPLPCPRAQGRADPAPLKAVEQLGGLL